MARWHHVLLALVFLSRLPVGRFLPPRVLPLSDAAWAFPIAGIVLGVLASLPLWLTGPGLLPAALSISLLTWLTGALHEDALADFADAGGGRDLADRLRIMRDSTIGSFGAMALICITVLRILSLGVLTPSQLVAAVALARVAPVVLMRALPLARQDGLAQGAGQPSRGDVTAAGMICIIAATLFTGPAQALAAALAAAAAGGFVWRRAARLLGGQTGDVLGAATLLSETAALVALALLT
ncbi:adenosylcobinamide-GDP ribazoletransferase [Paracoccus rhizosphaerae]|uniref:Adenosylcobinamide-GDP ribazoletransferase n=1 Tax=Paracoccus rhizosphaerae TaxID=1133347 RepID=A0ABV6CJ10_9RHOB|nr:adenosylcobinamide-GDP ribazoletransferase [Paracoccus rhizosphaerae]